MFHVLDVQNKNRLKPPTHTPHGSWGGGVEGGEGGKLNALSQIIITDNLISHHLNVAAD